MTDAAGRERAWVRDRGSIVAGILISIVSLGGCVWWALGQPAPSFPTSSRSITLLSGAVAVLGLAVVLRGLRWSLIFRMARIHTAPAEPYALVAVGYMGNTVLPLRGGEALRIVLLRERSDVGWAGAIGALIPERVLDVVSLVLVFTTLVASGVVSTPGGAAPAVIGAVALALALIGFRAYRMLRRRGRLQGLAERLSPLAHASRPLLGLTGLWLLILSICFWVVDGTIFWLVAEALSLDLSLLEALGLAVVAAAFSTIPSGPAFAGTVDAALLFALSHLDVAAPEAIAYVILLRFVTFVPVVIAGLIVAVGRYGGLGRIRAALARGEGGAAAL